MFKDVTKIKGLIIDIDSFEEHYREWEPLFEQYQCCFMTEEETLYNELQECYGTNKVLYLEFFEKYFAPSEATHSKVLELMGLSTTEVAYVSKDESFINNALGFLSGTILVKRIPVTYVLASRCPDLVFNSVEILIKRLNAKKFGFYGENSISPESLWKKGSWLPIIFEKNEEEIKLFSLGRYFGYSHYVNQMHPYSLAIYQNKNKNSKAYGVFNSHFAELYSTAAMKIKADYNVDCICNVPVRPNKENRFQPIVSHISRQTGLENISEHFICMKNYESQKSFSGEEREENIKGVFLYTGKLSGKKVILIDDVISTGSTIKECVTSLKKAGAEEVIVLVLAVNQLGGTYWSINQPIVQCPACSGRMQFLVNSYQRTFFYRCYQCNINMTYKTGTKQLIENINAEFSKNTQDEDMEFLA